MTLNKYRFVIFAAYCKLLRENCTALKSYNNNNLLKSSSMCITIADAGPTACNVISYHDTYFSPFDCVRSTININKSADFSWINFIALRKRFNRFTPIIIAHCIHYQYSFCIQFVIHHQVEYMYILWLIRRGVQYNFRIWIEWELRRCRMCVWLGHMKRISILWFA